MRRREFITLIFGAAAEVWPLAARAQRQPEHKRIIGVLLPLVEDDTYARTEVDAFVVALQQAGWTDRRNARIEIRWAGPTPRSAGRGRRRAISAVTRRSWSRWGPTSCSPTVPRRSAHYYKTRGPCRSCFR